MRLEHFQMIDRIVALDVAGHAIRAVCRVPRESPIFEGHFPGYPLMPGVLLLECMAQTTGWLVMALARFSAMPFLMAVKNAKFRAAVLPDDVLEFAGRVVHEGSGFTVGECKGRRQDKVVCEAEITYRIAPFPNPEFRRAMFANAERLGVAVKELSK